MRTTVPVSRIQGQHRSCCSCRPAAVLFVVLILIGGVVVTIWNTRMLDVLG